MTRINTNVSSLRGLRNLTKANDRLNTSLTRLSTGLKINSGKDNPSGLIASETLRFQVSAIEQSITNSNRASNVISTADAALGEIGGLLNQVRGLIQESLNSGAISQSEIEANQLQIDAALAAINSISANTNFAGDRLIDGSKSFITQVSNADAAKLSDFQVNEASLNGSSIAIEATIRTAAEKAELFYTGGQLSTAATLEVSGSNGSQVVFLGGASTTADIKKAINAASEITGVVATQEPGAEFEFGATQGVATISGQGIANTLAVDFGTATNQVTFTDARATGSLGSNASLGGAVRVAVIDTAGSTTSTLGVSSVQTTTTGVLITIELGNGATGGVTSTVSDIVSLINNGTSANALAAREFISAASTGTTATGTATTAAAAALAGGVDGGAISFNDARNEGLGGSAATLGGEVFVQFIEAGTATADLSVASITTDAESGNTTIQVQLGRSSGANTSTVSDILALINNGTSANAVSAREYVSATATSAAQSSTTVFGAQAEATLLTGGGDGLNNDLTFNDARAYGADGTISVALTAPSTANSALSISVASTASGDSTVTINLATDADGNVTTTAAQIREFLLTSTSTGAVDARALVSLEVEGDGSDLVAAATAIEVDAESAVLRMQSTEYGKREYVQVNVLSGSFATTSSNYETESRRDTGRDLEAIINGQVATSKGLAARIKTTSLDASITFNEANNVEGARAVINVTGGGAVFQIGQQVNAAGQIGIGIEAVNTARLGGITGKLYELGTGGGKSLLDVGNDVRGETLVGIVEEAVNRVATLRGRLGAVQKNLIDTNINTLGVALENISEARSAIVDTDFAESTAELTKAQILTQAGISVLTIANQNPQQALSLLG